MESANEMKKFEVAEIHISYKPKVKLSDRPKILSSKDAEKILRETWDSDKLELVEEFRIVLLNRANKVLGILEVSLGGIAGTVVDPKIVLAPL